jgi:hypothetical protein
VHGRRIIVRFCAVKWLLERRAPRGVTQLDADSQPPMLDTPTVS